GDFIDRDLGIGAKVGAAVAGRIAADMTRWVGRGVGGCSGVAVTAGNRGGGRGVDPALAQVELAVAVGVARLEDRRNAGLIIRNRDAAQSDVADVGHGVAPTN